MDETPKNNALPEMPSAAPSPATEKQSPPPESRMQRFWARAPRWVLTFLIVLGLGVLLGAYLLYRPVANQLRQTQGQLTQVQEQAKSDLDEANQQIADLEQRVQTLTALETKNQDLQADLESANMHVYIMSARADVAAAQLALAQDDASKARIALSKTDQTLKDLSGLLDVEHQRTATDMQKRLALALEGIGTNTNAAVSDLNVLATDLLELENAFFAKP